MLFGKSPNAFKKEVFEGMHMAAKEHKIWRKQGSVGKWHNIAVVSGWTFNSIIFTYQVVGSEQIRYMDRHAEEGPGHWVSTFRRASVQGPHSSWCCDWQRYSMAFSTVNDRACPRFATILRSLCAKSIKRVEQKQFDKDRQYEKGLEEAVLSPGWESHYW